MFIMISFWSGTTCSPPLLSRYVIPSVYKNSYKIGDSMLLTCADGRQRTGPEEILCNAGLSWSPEPKNTQCAAGNLLKVTDTHSVLFKHQHIHYNQNQHHHHKSG